MLKKIIAFGLLCCASAATADQLMPGDNTPMPDLRWLDGDGGQHRLSEIGNKAKLLHFWATWCIPCREEMPELIAWRKQNPQIEVLPLSLDEKIAQSKHFIKKFNFDMAPLLLNEDDANALAMPVVPYTILVSADNRFIAYYPGVAPWQDQAFTQQVRALLLE